MAPAADGSLPITQPWRVSPASTAQKISRGKWKRPQHLDYASRKVSQLWEKPLRLIFMWPPRHGKSELLSKWTPVWYLNNWPDNRIILSSYGAEFATEWGRAVRNIIQANPELGISLSEDVGRQDNFKIADREGGMVTVGVGGALTGRGADLLIVDDPVKNDEQAQSHTYRERTYEWFKATARTRLEPGGSIIIVMTRWHEDDLVGKLLEEEPDDWEVIRFPALAEENDVLGRMEGESLWPERFDERALEEIKTTLGSYWWSSLYQQRPAPQEGGLFKRHTLGRFRQEGIVYKLTNDKSVDIEDCWRFCTADVASSLKQKADYTVIACWAVTPDNDLLLVDLIRLRLESPDLINLLQVVNNDFHPGFIGIEKQNMGLAIIQQCRRKGMPIRELDAGRGDKWVRAQPVAAMVEANKVFLRADAPWLGDVVEELTVFPNGSHDDIVDVFSYAGIRIARREAVGNGPLAQIL